MKRLFKRKIPFLFCLTGISLPGWAVEEVSTLEVWTKKGEKITYYLKDNPVASYSGEELVLKANEVTVCYPLSELHKFTLGTEATSVEDVETVDGKIQLEGESLNLSGFRTGETVAIFNINGQRISASRIDADGCTDFSLQNLTKGIYVIRIGSLTHKIIKK